MRPEVVLTNVKMKKVNKFYNIIKCINICPCKKGPRGLRLIALELDGQKFPHFNFENTKHNSFSIHLHNC